MINSVFLYDKQILSLEILQVLRSPAETLVPHRNPSLVYSFGISMLVGLD